MARNRRRAVLLVPFAAALFAVPGAALADHCGAAAAVTPTAGPPGTAFLFTTNLGGDAMIYLFRNDRLVRDASIETDGPIGYAVETTAADAGRWTVRAELGNAPECDATATFDVRLPDTASLARTDLEPKLPMGVLTVMVVVGTSTCAAWRRRQRHEGMVLVASPPVGAISGCDDANEGPQQEQTLGV